MANGVYWTGTDGNVYVSGSQGVNIAGKKDSNTDNYWRSRGYSAIADPNYNPADSHADYASAFKAATGKVFTGGVGQESEDLGPGSAYGSGGSSTQRQAANNQIDQINRLLGVIDSQGQAGLGRLDSSYNDTKTRLGEQKAKTMDRYGQQYITNDKDKQRGIEQVDDFANTSYNSLQRVLQGANAGNSSVGRTLMPYLVNKGASSRRQGVFDTAGENQREIDMAKGDAEDQFRYAFQDTDNQYNEQKQGFLSNIEQQKMDLLAKKLGLEQDAGLATAGTEAELNSRTAALQSLFGQYAPSFTARAMNLKTPELGKYTLDPGQIKLGQNQGSGSYYTNPIKKRQELEA